MVLDSSANSGNSPCQLQDELWVFPKNIHSHGGQAWWLGCEPEPVLIDCPPVNDFTLEFLKHVSSGRSPLIILTSREAHGKVLDLQEALDWPVLVQEQEAYLLPGLKRLSSFSNEHVTASGLRLLWTPGPTPGSCVVYAPTPWNVLFCGRLLIPVKLNCLAALRTRRTFHWSRQQKSLENLCQWLPSDSRPSLASGASLQALGAQKLSPWESWDIAEN